MNENPAATEETRLVHGRELTAFTRMAGRTAYLLHSQGVTYRLTPDSKATYLLRRQSDGYSGVFATLEEAVASIDALEREED
jgi:hypothetical protein